jgi:hypothetical protein
MRAKVAVARAQKKTPPVKLPVAGQATDSEGTEGKKGVQSAQRPETTPARTFPDVSEFSEAELRAAEGGAGLEESGRAADPQMMMNRLELELQSTRSGFSHRHMSSGCGFCSKNAMRYQG